MDHSNIEGSEDMGWMLQSIQVTDQVLIEELAAMYGADLFRLVSHHLPSNERHQALSMMSEMLATSTFRRRQFWGDITFPVWLDQIAEECVRSHQKTWWLRIVNRRDPGDDQSKRIPFEFDPSHLPQIVEGASRRLTALRKRQRLGRMARQAAFLSLILFAFIWFLQASNLFTTGPTPTPSSPTQTRILHTPTPSDAITFSYQIQSGDTINSIAERVGVSSQTIIDLNRISNPSNLSPTFAIKLPFQILLPEFAPDPLPSSLPLLLESSPKEIIGRIENSNQYWRSLWASVHSVSYGSLGYAGPPTDSQWSQVWIRQPDHVLQIQGTKERGLYNISLQTNDLIFYRYGHNIMGSFIENSTPIGGPLDYPFPVDWDPAEITVVGREGVASRNALIIERRSGSSTGYLSRYWVDVLTGVILRRQIINTSHGFVVLWECAVTEIRYDVEIPARIFADGISRWTWFAREQDGQPLPEGVPPPSLQWKDTAAARRPNTCSSGNSPIDYENEPLTLAWYMVGLERAECEPPAAYTQDAIAVYLGNSYLGNLDLETDQEFDPQFQSCARSPDGRRLVVLVNNPRFQMGSTYLFWLDLSLSLHAHLITVHSTVDSYVFFAPDSRRFAYSACSGGECGVSVYDTGTGKQTLFPLDEDIHLTYFNWSPDGEALGLITYNFQPGSDVSMDSYDLKVIDASTGEELYSGPFSWQDWENGRLPAGSPVQTWDHFLLSEEGCMWP